jgi:IS5 family transposase
VERAKKARLMSSEHFTVDGTLIDAWASLKSFRPRGKRRGKRPPPNDPGNPSVDFHGQKRSNRTHESSTDPESRLMRKGTGKEAKLSYAEHALMENRHGLLVDLRITEANGTAERDAALDMLTDLPGGARITVGGDAGYDVRAFVHSCRDHKITPHIARNRSHPERSAVDRRTLRHAGYDVSQKIRKRIEEVWGWMKTVGNFRRTRFRGRKRTELAAYLVGAAYNLLRMARLLEAPA